MTTKFIGTKELRQNMAKIAERAQKEKSRIIVLKKNRPIFELRPLSDSESLTESFRRDIEGSRKQAKKGKVFSEQEVLKEFGV